jgi:hypothetical protein
VQLLASGGSGKRYVLPEIFGHRLTSAAI